MALSPRRQQLWTEVHFAMAVASERGVIVSHTTNAGEVSLANPTGVGVAPIGVMLDDVEAMKQAIMQPPPPPPTEKATEGEPLHGEPTPSEPMFHPQHHFLYYLLAVAVSSSRLVLVAFNGIEAIVVLNREPRKRGTIPRLV